MTGTGLVYLGTSFSLLLIVLVTAVLFGYIWLRSHGVTHVAHAHMAHAHVDAMAGDEGEA